MQSGSDPTPHVEGWDKSQRLAVLGLTSWSELVAHGSGRHGQLTCDAAGVVLEQEVIQGVPTPAHSNHNTLLQYLSATQWTHNSRMNMMNSVVETQYDTDPA